jgi:hydrogenase small subunit
MGAGQADISKITEAFAHDAPWGPGWASKPKVIWVHGAECTGCSTSLLGLFEDVRAKAIEGRTESTLAALDLAVGGTGDGTTVLNSSTGHPFGHRTVVNSAAVTGSDFDNKANTNGAYIANIADVLIDFIDLQYHETVMGMGGDLAAQWLKDNMAGSSSPFVLVVEGAVQDRDNVGYWGESNRATPWCSIGMSDDGSVEHSFDEVVLSLANQASCAAIVAIGQCACFGGYPACKSPVLAKDANGLARGASMTGAQGVYDFLVTQGSAAANKVINAPGCPTNPWWFVLTVVAWLVDFVNPNTLGILDASHNIIPTAVDSTRRLKAVYGIPLHGPACSRYQDFLNGNFATHPGQSGCLQLIGCKGPSAKSLCHVHGWNALQPRNDGSWENSHNSLSVNSKGVKVGSACTMAGHPCMACTEKGYPDSFVPFVVR